MNEATGTIPAAMMIESAIDTQKRESAPTTADKTKELESACWQEAQSPEFVSGYLLGIQTAQIMLQMRGESL